MLRISPLALLLGALALSSLSPAQALVFNVDSEVDFIDLKPGDGQCRTEFDTCTLRAAVQEANASAGADEIVLPAGTYTLNLGGAGEDLAAEGDLDIVGDLEIRGAGSAATVIDGNSSDRIFHQFKSHERLSLVGVTLQNGVVTNAFGGAVFSLGQLTLSDTVAQNNKTLMDGYDKPAKGGAIYCDALHGRDVKFLNNSSASSGGAVSTRFFQFQRAVFRDNRAATNGGAIQGTGVFQESHLTANQAQNGGAIHVTQNLLWLENSTIDGNIATASGGALFIPRAANSPEVTLVNVTISGNEAMEGGGIYTWDTPVELVNVTLNDNQADTGANIFGHSRMRNSIISSPRIGSSCNTGQTSLGFNLDSADSCALRSTGDKINTDPLLAVLANNGGFSPSHALAANSPAIGGAAMTYCPQFDQRLMFRPTDRCDMGAFDSNAVAGTVGAATFGAVNYMASRTDAEITLDVQRVDGSDGSLRVLLVATNFSSDSPLGLTGFGSQQLRGTSYANALPLEWSSGDNSDRQITLPIVDKTFFFDKFDSYTINFELIPATMGASQGAIPFTSVTIEKVATPLPTPEPTVIPGFFYARVSTLPTESGGQAIFEVVRNDGSDGQASIDYRVEGRTAIAGEDFEAVSGSLVWEDGEDGVKEIHIPIHQDNLREGQESMLLHLDNAQGASFSSNEYPLAVPIFDADDAGVSTIYFESGSYAFYEDQGEARVVLLREGDVDAYGYALLQFNGMTPDYLYKNNQARLEWDVMMQTEWLTFAPGESRKEITFEILEDDIDESHETFSLVIRQFEGNLSWSDGNITEILIVEDDGPIVDAYPTIINSTPSEKGEPGTALGAGSPWLILLGLAGLIWRRRRRALG